MTRSDPGPGAAPLPSRPRPTWLAPLLAGLLAASGCSRPPQVSGEHRELILQLATATSAANPDWLEAVARQVVDRQSQGSLSEAEDRAFSEIIDLARSGRWDEARDAAYALRDAQGPPAGDDAGPGLPKARKPPRPGR